MRDGGTAKRNFAKTMRRKMTNAERILWSRLRGNALLGFHFRRQHPLGPYIADFACVSARLIVEVDGMTHSSDEEFRHDRRRDAYLKKQGWRVVHVWNEEVYRELESVLYAIEGALTSKDWDG